MKKRITSLLIALILIGLNVVVAFANPYLVDHDTFVDASTNNYNSVPFLSVTSSGASGCTPVSGGLLQMDMTRIVQDTIGTVTLDMLMRTISTSGDVTLELFAAAANIDETTAVGPLAGWVGASLGSMVVVSAATPDDTIITFPTTPALVAHMEAARAGGTDAGVVVQITGCPGTGSSAVTLGVREAAEGAEFNFWNPSMVKLNNLDSSSPTNIVLWVGVVVLLVAVVSLFIFRRREHQP